MTEADTQSRLCTNNHENGNPADDDTHSTQNAANPQHALHVAPHSSGLQHLLLPTYLQHYSCSKTLRSALPDSSILSRQYQTKRPGAAYPLTVLYIANASLGR
eukprot:327534-Rhodomonas_salina.2